MTSPARASEVLLHAAGSLRAALTDVADAYETASRNTVRGTYGASGTLRDRIAAGEPSQVFASANMGHPQSLAEAGKSSPVVLFARNRLCALVRPELAATPSTLLEQMLSPNVKVGTSTPKADPSGDYAFEVFAKVDDAQAVHLLGLVLADLNAVVNGDHVGALRQLVGAHRFEEGEAHAFLRRGGSGVDVQNGQVGA